MSVLLTSAYDPFERANGIRLPPKIATRFRFEAGLVALVFLAGAGFLAAVVSTFSSTAFLLAVSLALVSLVEVLFAAFSFFAVSDFVSVALTTVLSTTGLSG